MRIESRKALKQQVASLEREVTSLRLRMREREMDASTPGNDCPFYRIIVTEQDDGSFFWALKWVSLIRAGDAVANLGHEVACGSAKTALKAERKARIAIVDEQMRDRLRAERTEIRVPA